ncbi:minor tail protein [Mycobacterium phage Phlei]|uniref:Minor tail protein n=1 Tax=Mycobacterium phage Phlei TaxID=1690684 RepID=A0A0N9BDQ6_9CAUD|nr:minor tail protein [Mycobacterium phage Phlei]ALA48138.1 hypothetical protein [Mycobacterium phage Phlei]
MNSIFNPDNGWEVALLAFMALCTLAGTVYPVWAKLKKIDGQVSNDHQENLREEITRNFKEIRQEFADFRKEIHDDITGLRADLRTERIERIEGDKRKEVA